MGAWRERGSRGEEDHHWQPLYRLREWALGSCCRALSRRVANLLQVRAIPGCCVDRSPSRSLAHGPLSPGQQQPGWYEGVVFSVFLEGRARKPFIMNWRRV